jgi:hypothetical protein
VSGSLHDVGPNEGEDMDSYVERTAGLGVAASLRRASWVMGASLGDVLEVVGQLTEAERE